MKIVWKFHVCNFYIFQEIWRQKALRLGWAMTGRVGLGWFIVLNDSANPKMGIKMYFNFFPIPIFLKVLELFECRRGDQHMTANRNFVRLTRLL